MAATKEQVLASLAKVPAPDGKVPVPNTVLVCPPWASVPMLAVYLLYAIATGIGFTLLLVPGIFLAVIWSMAMVAMVAEEPGVFGAFKRSAALTNGARWKILGILLLTVAIALIVNLLGGFVVLTAGLRPETQPAALPAQIVMSLLNTKRGRITGRTSGWRKAVVTLAAGQKIQFFEGV